MNYLDLSIEELHELLVKKVVTPLELTTLAIEKAKLDTNNAFEYICEKEALEFAKTLTIPEEDNVFWGIPYVAKDNISTKDILTTASSNILNDYVPVFDAEVIKRLKDKKAVLIGKVTLDELAMGGTGTTGHLGATYNPYDPSHTYMIGGSSCGSAVAVCNSIVPFSLGSDTGDSVRKPASYSGLVGLKPTWGRISRYGLFPFAPSLDHIGYFTRNIKDSALLLNVLAGRDNKDSTSSLKDVEDYTSYEKVDVKGKKVAIIKEIIDGVEDETVLSSFNKTVDVLKENGIEVEYVSFPYDLLKAILPIYLIISCAEATSNNANLDGIKFGFRKGDESSYSEIMFNARTEGFSKFIKRRFIIGSYSLYKANQDRLFIAAQKARRLIVDKTNDILSKFDAIYLPSVAEARNPIAGRSGKSELFNIAENYMAIANFAGLPSISLPIGLDKGFPFGGNLTCRAFEEVNLFAIANVIEKSTGLKDLTCGKVSK